MMRRPTPALAIIPASQPKQQIRRIFNNEQLIERFDRWLLICGKAANTRIAYTYTARQFGKFLVDKPLTAATKDDVRAFIAVLFARGMKATTIQARLEALRVFFDCLELGGQVRVSVPRYVERRKLPQGLPKAKSEEEIERIIAAAQTPRDLAVIELLYASGLRVAELAKLRCEDVDLQGRSLIVRQGKGGNDRIALFGRRAAAALREYLGDRRTGFLIGPLETCQQRKKQCGGVSCDRYGAWWGFWRVTDINGLRVMRAIRLGDYELGTRERARLALAAYLKDKLEQSAPKPRKRNVKPGTGLSVKAIWRIVTDTAKRAGVEGVHPHTFRHSMATHCLDHGMDIRHVQELLGHVSLVTTQKYLHLSTAKLKQVHSKFFPRGR